MTKKIVIIIILCTTVAAYEQIKLKDVGAITFKSGLMTTGRRSAPVSQVQCHGHLCHYSPEIFQCKNTGFDGISVQWKCEGDLPSWASFKNSNVSCEGYSYPTDPYILVGSCSFIYSLQGTPPHNLQKTNVGYIIIGIIILLLCCNSRQRNRNYGNDFATGAAIGGAAGYALGRNRSNWGGGWWPRRRYTSGRSNRSTRWGGGASSSRRTAKRTAFCGTVRR